jgi:Carboxypeptidase regulatory-like domain
MRAAIVVILCCAAALRAYAQDAPAAGPAQQDWASQDQVHPDQANQDQAAQGQSPQSQGGATAALHGLVRNAVTGAGVPRALVRIEGDVETGALTDGDGRFEIDGVPAGSQAVDVSRPGFFNPAFAGSTEAASGATGPPRNVLVAVGMPDVIFTLAPTCAIEGRIDLSTGDPAEGIEVGLVHRVVADGRAVWQASGFTRTRSDGSYRFGGLADGQYVVYTMPAFDGEPFTTLVASGQAAAAQRWGYASVYYPDARGPAGATAISVSNGSDAQANFTLTREPFQTVSITLPQGGTRNPVQYTAELTDGAGHSLPYPTQYDASAHTFQAALPDGAYAMLITAAPQPIETVNQRESDGSGGILAGEADFTVAGRPIAGLRASLAPVASSPVQVSIMHGEAASGATGSERVVVMLSPASGPLGGSAGRQAGGQPGGAMGGALMGQYATGPADGPLQSSYMAPGPYWVHTYLGGRGLCESSFTAGGASLGREPLTVSLSGQTAPLQLTLRDDCAQLALSLPESLMETGAGEEKFYTAYAVPDFDFAWDLTPVVLRPSSGGRFTLPGLTPGNYHVYLFAGEANLAYHDPAALAALPNPGQAVTLSPGATASLVLEAPAQ